MTKKLLKWAVLMACVALCACNSTPVYKDASAPIEKRIKDLMSLMTIEEKAAQLDMLSAPDILVDRETLNEEKSIHFIDSMGIGSIHDFYPPTAKVSNELQRRAIENTRLGIPILFIEEGLHGYEGEGATCFPVNLANASSWDTTLLYKIGRVIGTEARSKGVHFLLSPNLDVGRDPRWGRIEETYGEDFYLNSRMAVNMIKGMQNDSKFTSNSAVAAEPKHFGVHGVPESGSNTGPAYMGEREIRNTIYVFEKAVREANARGIMAAYHDIDGVPCISSHWLLTEVLRDEWGFDGMVVTDLGAIRRLLTTHFTATDPKDATAQAINAGLDMQFYDFDHEVFQQAVIDGVKDGTITKKAIDRAVSAVLRVKFELGLFDNPYTDEALAGQVFHSQEHIDLALEAGHKSIVMLKNNNNTLPLSKNVKKVALIGNLANMSSIGGYSPRGARGETIYEAFKKRFGNDVQVNLVPSELSNRSAEISYGALSNSVKPNETGLYGEYFNNMNFTGAPAYTNVDQGLAFNWHNLVPAPGVNGDNFSVRWTGYLTAPSSGLYEFNLVSDDYGRLYLNNQMLIDNWGEKAVARRGQTAQIRLTGGQRIPIKVEYGEVDENASISVRWRLVEVSDNSSYLAGVTRAAAAADAVIVVLGETNQEVGEGKDRQDLNMRASDIAMLQAAGKAGKPVVCVMLNGRPLVTAPMADNSAALLEAWFPGELGGTAVLDVLFGDYNPSGRLTISIPRYQGPMPIYYSKHPSSRRSYTDGNGVPLYSFGHGLSYSAFEYSNLKITPENPTMKDKITVTLDVKNTSNVDGVETVQLYVRDKIATVATPIMALKGFSQVALKAGETKTVSMDVIPSEHLWLINLGMQRVVEPGEFDFMVGASSTNIKFTETVNLSK